MFDVPSAVLRSMSLFFSSGFRPFWAPEQAIILERQMDFPPILWTEALSGGRGFVLPFDQTP